MELIESTLNQLYQSTVDGFPSTTKRQHATHTIKITNLTWIPFKELNTLFIKGLAQNEGREYNPIILFKKVNYREGTGKGIISIKDSIKQDYYLEKLNENDVLLRCNCMDFHWRFNYTDHLDKSLYGRKRRKYEATTNRGPANPNEVPGMCKHLLKMWQALIEANLMET